MKPSWLSFTASAACMHIFLLLQPAHATLLQRLQFTCIAVTGSYPSKNSQAAD